MGITYLDSHRRQTTICLDNTKALITHNSNKFRFRMVIFVDFSNKLCYGQYNIYAYILSNNTKIRQNNFYQLSFDFMDVPPNNVILLVSKNKLGYLCYGVHDMFRTYDPKLAAAAIHLEDYGYRTIGDLVQAQEQTLRDLPFMSNELMDTMKEGLQTMGLRLGLVIPRTRNGSTFTPTSGWSR